MNILRSSIVLAFVLFASIIGNCQDLVIDPFLQLKIDEKVNEVKRKIHKYDTGSAYVHDIDTSQFTYIPVFNGCLAIPDSDSNCLQKFYVYEVLLYEKSKEKIVGSARFGKNEKFYLSYFKHKKYMGEIPLRYEDRLPAIPPQNYSTICKFLTEEGGTLVYVNEIKALVLLNNAGAFIKFLQLEE